jgi:hypothetical protein
MVPLRFNCCTKLWRPETSLVTYISKEAQAIEQPDTNPIKTIDNDVPLTLHSIRQPHTPKGTPSSFVMISSSGLSKLDAS